MVSAGAGELPCLLAMDPGRAKCGLAVVQWDGRVLARAVVPSERALAQAQAWSRTYRPRYLVLGDGTTGRAWRDRLAGAEGLPPVVLVDEAHSRGGPAPVCGAPPAGLAPVGAGGAPDAPRTLR